MSDLSDTSEMQSAFENDAIWNAKNEDLKKYLRVLNSNKVTNPNVQHRTVIQALTINHIQMSRLIAELENRNNKTQFWFLVVAVGSLAVGALAIVF